jgi:hypothetical protein
MVRGDENRFQDDWQTSYKSFFGLSQSEEENDAT